jgi:hypothetical protein
MPELPFEKWCVQKRDEIPTAFKSLSTSAKFLHPLLPGHFAGSSTMYLLNSSPSNIPSFTSLKLTISAPSSRREVDVGGIDPGRIPPMSAWWPREAVKKMISLRLVVGLGEGEKTGVMMVMSGRCLREHAWDDGY